MQSKKGSKIKQFLILWVIAEIAIVVIAGFFGCLFKGNGLSFSAFIEGYKSLLTWAIFAIISGIVFIAILLNYSLNVKKDVMRENADLEDSHFQSKSELRKNEEFTCSKFSELKNVEDGVVVGAQVKGRDIDIVMTQPSHTLTVGTTGSGKSEAFIKPNIEILARTKTKPSMIIADVKGELYLAHAKTLEDQGYNVLLLNIAEPYSSVRWNPCESILNRIREIKEILDIRVVDGKYVTQSKTYLSLNAAKTRESILRDEIYEYSKDLVWAICPIENKTQPNWEKGARGLILALVLAFTEDVISEKMSEEQFCLYNIYYNLQRYCNADVEELTEYLINSRDPFSQVPGHAKSVLLTQDNTLASYLSDVAEYIAWLSDNGICSLTSDNEIYLRDFDEKPTALFIKVPDHRETRHKLVTLFTMQAYKEFVSKAEQNERDHVFDAAQLKRNVYFILDEFGNLPKIYNLQTLITVSRSRKIFLMLVVQSYKQLNEKYGNDIADIVKGQCINKVYIGTDEESTVKEFSTLCGKRTVQKVSLSSSGNTSESANASTGATEIPLINPGDLKRINQKGNYGNLILARFGQYPVRSFITPYFESKKIFGHKETTLEVEPRIMDKEKIVFDIAKIVVIPEIETGEDNENGGHAEAREDVKTYREALEDVKTRLTDLVSQLEKFITQADYNILKTYAADLQVSSIKKLLEQLKEEAATVAIKSNFIKVEKQIAAAEKQLNELVAQIEQSFSEGERTNGK